MARSTFLCAFGMQPRPFTCTAAMVRLLHFADQQICGGVRKGHLITGRIQEEE